MNTENKLPETKVKHTPGPWKLVITNDDRGTPMLSIQKDEGQSDSVLLSVGAVFLSNSSEDDERVANAKLIAAAPELLEALVYAYERLRDFDPKPDSLIEQTIKKATE